MTLDTSVVRIGTWNVNPSKNMGLLKKHIDQELAGLNLDIVALQEMWATDRTQSNHLQKGIPRIVYKESSANLSSSKNMGAFVKKEAFELHNELTIPGHEKFPLANSYYETVINNNNRRKTRNGFKSWHDTFKTRVHFCVVTDRQTGIEVILAVVHMPNQNGGNAEMKAERGFIFCCIADMTENFNKPCIALGDWNCPPVELKSVRNWLFTKAMFTEIACPKFDPYNPKERYIEYFAVIRPRALACRLRFIPETIEGRVLPDHLQNGVLGTYRHKLVVVDIVLLRPPTPNVVETSLVDLPYDHHLGLFNRQLEDARRFIEDVVSNLDWDGDMAKAAKPHAIPKIYVETAKKFLDDTEKQHRLVKAESPRKRDETSAEEGECSEQERRMIALATELTAAAVEVESLAEVNLCSIEFGSVYPTIQRTLVR